MYSQEEIDRMIMTYTYYVIQKISLDVIAVKFPKLEKNANIAATEWEREYIPSIENIDQKLKDTLKNEWENNKSLIHYKYSGTDYSTVSEKDAKAYIDEVFQRSVGKMQSPVIETLLIFKPGYLENPEKEFTDNYLNTFSTSTLKKPIGIDIKFFFPKSWKPSPGDAKTGLIQSFTNQYGLGKLIMSFYIIKSRKDFTPSGIGQLLAEDYLKKLLTKNDQFIIYIPGLQIDNCPASNIRYWREEMKIDKKFTMYCESYHTYYKNFHLIVNFSIWSDTGNKDEILKKYNLYHKLMRRVLKSIVIVSQWEQKRF